jgi:hypothetical protein
MHLILIKCLYPNQNVFFKRRYSLSVRNVIDGHLYGYLKSHHLMETFSSCPLIVYLLRPGTALSGKDTKGDNVLAKVACLIGSEDLKL